MVRYILAYNVMARRAEYIWSVKRRMFSPFLIPLPSCTSKALKGDCSLVDVCIVQYRTMMARSGEIWRDPGARGKYLYIRIPDTDHGK
jgi:hypothetical protein